MNLSKPTNYRREEWQNGCGPEGFETWVPEFSFHECCEIHDWEYHYAKNLGDKVRGDWRFFWNMLTVAFSSWWKWVYLLPVAVIYFVTVLICGTCQKGEIDV